MAICEGDINMNRIIMIGRLTNDPELKYTPGAGTAVATFTLAVDRTYKKDGQPDADFIPIVVWGKTAESVSQYTSKGKLIAVAGRIQTRSYEDKKGDKRYITEVVAEEVRFLEWAKKDGESKDYVDMTPVDGGDIPF